MDVLEKGLRFQGEAVWWLPRALPPSSQGRDPCSRGGRHTWLPAPVVGKGQKRAMPISAALRHTWDSPHGAPASQLKPPTSTRTWVQAYPPSPVVPGVPDQHSSGAGGLPSFPHPHLIQFSRTKGLWLTDAWKQWSKVPWLIWPLWVHCLNHIPRGPLSRT